MTFRLEDENIGKSLLAWFFSQGCECDLNLFGRIVFFPMVMFVAGLWWKFRQKTFTRVSVAPNWWMKNLHPPTAAGTPQPQDKG